MEAALDGATMEEALNTVEDITSFPDRLTRYMLANPASVGRPCGARLLARAFKGGWGRMKGAILDLSRSPLLGDDDILYVVKYSTSAEEVTGIDLSNNHNVSAKCVKGLVDMCPRLKTVVAINTPALRMSDLLRCLDSSESYDIFHTDYFRAAFAAHRSVQGLSQGPFAGDLTTAPYIEGPNCVTQIFYYYDNLRRRPESGISQGSSETTHSGLHWEDAIEKLKQDDRGLSVRAFVKTLVRFIPLHDTILAPGLTPDWFPQVFRLAIHHRNS